MINNDLLAILACPLCRADIRPEGEVLVCTRPECGCRYRIDDNIPVMLIEEAERPCPKCGKQRDWIEVQDTLKCAQCGNVFKPQG